MDLEVKWRGVHENKISITQTISHSLLLFSRQGDVSRKLNQTFLLVGTLNSNFYRWRTFNYI